VTPPADSSGWLDLVVSSMIATWRTLARTNGAHVFEREGMVALATPAVPERSVFNSVGYTDAAAFLAAYDELRADYDERGCAWTVWVPEGDVEVARRLESNGHVLDAAPRAMAMSLAEVVEPDLGDIEWTADGDIRTACLINDHSYGYPEGTWTKFNDEAADDLRTYIAEEDGRPAATAATVRHDRDCEIWSVATEPAARGRGLSTALMRQAIWDARNEGCETSSLQATRLGRPVYERVGFEDFGALHMWELRPPELAADATRMPPA
jgi:GNAT superfamily N-acetyltransferase